MAVNQEMLPDGESLLGFEERLGLLTEQSLAVYSLELASHQRRLATEQGITVEDLHYLPEINS